MLFSRSIRSLGAILTLAAVPSMMAQKWEVGAAGGGSFFTAKNVTAGSVTGKAGFNNGLAYSAWVGNTNARRVGGEIRYSFQEQDARLESNGRGYTFGSRMHTIHYDFLFYGGDSESTVRPYAAIGAGYRRYEGTGREVAVQPLSNLAFLTRTTDWKPVISMAGGLRFQTSNRLAFRIEFRNYMTQLPKNVITAAPGAKITGNWMQNYMVLFGASYLF
jgi:hypothetical protein